MHTLHDPVAMTTNTTASLNRTYSAFCLSSFSPFHASFRQVGERMQQGEEKRVKSKEKILILSNFLG